jgi:hypothetical protein
MIPFTQLKKKLSSSHQSFSFLAAEIAHQSLTSKSRKWRHMARLKENNYDWLAISNKVNHTERKKNNNKQKGIHIHYLLQHSFHSKILIASA